MELRLITKVTLIRISSAGVNKRRDIRTHDSGGTSSLNDSGRRRPEGEGGEEGGEEGGVEEGEGRRKVKATVTSAITPGDQKEIEEERLVTGPEMGVDFDEEEHQGMGEAGAAGEERQEEEEADARHLALLRMAFRAHDLYFSSTCDVTLTAQGRADLSQPPSPSSSPSSSFPSSLLPGATPARPKARKLLLPLWQRADDRFFWNRPLLQPLVEAGADEWVLPVMSAYVQAVRNVSWTEGEREGRREGGREGGTLVLISRRSCRRQGRRFVKRGIDSEGDVANFVETEQLLIAPRKGGTGREGGNGGGSGGGLTSLVTVRGSLPLLWSSPANLKYTPAVHLHGTVEANVRAMARHYGDMLSRYGVGETGGEGPGGVPGVTLVNLIDKKKVQGRLGLAWRKIHALVMGVLERPQTGRPFLPPSLPPSLPPFRVAMTWFDFHAECAQMRWERLGLLLHALRPSLEGQGFFHMDAAGRVERRQVGVVRVNCMDCLDRTNVVQSVLARWSLRRQVEALREGGVEDGEEGGAGGREGEEEVLKLPYPGLEAAFRLLWSGNADALSVLYAGTPALKGDYTRTGKRTKTGMVADGLNSAKRYVINNFVDRENQQAVEILLGKEDGKEGGREGWVVWPAEEGAEGSGKEGSEWRRAVVAGGIVANEEMLGEKLSEVVPPLLKEGEREGGREGDGGLDVGVGREEEAEDVHGMEEGEGQEEIGGRIRGREGGREGGGEGGREGGLGWDVYTNENLARDAAAHAAQG
jgi:hypothetical protein